MSSASETVISPVPLSIAKGPVPSVSESVLPALMLQPFASASSPVDAMVSTESVSAAFSARLAELAVMAISTSSTVMVNVVAPAASFPTPSSIRTVTTYSLLTSASAGFS